MDRTGRRQGHRIGGSARARIRDLDCHRTGTGARHRNGDRDRLRIDHRTTRGGRPRA